MGFGAALVDSAADMALAAVEDKYARNAATKAWARSKEGATTAYERSRQSTTKAWGRSQTAAKTSRDWQWKLSSTAHQRGVADLRAAGLNPILAAMKGGASTPAGAMASGGAAQTTAAKSQMARSPSLSHVMGNAMQAYNLKAQGDLLTAQKGLVDENAEGVHAANEKKKFFARMWKNANKFGGHVDKEIKKEVGRQKKEKEIGIDKRKNRGQNTHYKNWSNKQQRKYPFPNEPGYRK